SSGRDASVAREWGRSGIFLRPAPLHKGATAFPHRARGGRVSWRTATSRGGVMAEVTRVRAASTGTDYIVELTDPAGHRWSADEPVALGGGNTAPDPMQLALSALGACTAITLKMYAARKQWP